ncbi:hypothetical protein G9A89_006402 [Geosiphon pyriformis]|nr:hypothetical protein G9A89_006402 [Geosiphon pyriformis]
MHDNNIIQLLAKWKQLKPETNNAYLITLSKDKLIVELLGIKKEYRSILHARIRLQQQKQIVNNIIKRQQNFKLSKGAMIKSILNRKKQRIVLNHVIKKGKFHDDLNEIKNLVNKKAQSWEHRFKPIESIPDYVFDGVMAEITNEEFKHILSHTLYNKAPGPLDIQSKLRTLLNAYIEAANIPEDTRKILTKILIARISNACKLHNVLKSYNTSVLKNTSTAVPIHVINAVTKHAREFENETWFTFQDMKKAYNSVG